MELFVRSFRATGTSWRIALPRASEAEGEAAVAAARARIEEFERAYSRFRPDSIVSQIAKAPGRYRLPDDAEGMLALYRELYDATGGKVTPTIGQVLVDAGYDPAYSLSPKEAVAPAKRWDEAFSYEPPFLVAREPVQLDFGAVGKGYIVDIVAKLLRDRSIGDFVVDAGGDIAHASSDGAGIRIGLEDPDDSSRAVGVVELANAGIAGSSGNRRKWDRFHHIIDATTAESPQSLKAVWAVAPTAALADAMATALFFADPEALRKRFGFEYALVRADRSAQVSPAFPGELLYS